MPRGDRTGPNGMGPATGRGAGFCNSFDRPGYLNGGAGTGFGYGRGFGGGRGRGMGYGRGFGYGFASPAGYAAYAPYSREGEKSFLENEIGVLKERLKAAESRLSDLSEED